MPANSPRFIFGVSFQSFRLAFIGALTLVAVTLVSAQTAESTYAFSHLAGPLGGFGNVDGAGSAARFSDPTSVAVDNTGNIYVADASNATIRKITTTGMVTTLAGTPRFPGNSTSTFATLPAAPLLSPVGVAVDNAGNVYVANQGQQTILKIMPTGVITVLAGTDGVSGTLDGIGSAAQFQNPGSVAVDSAGNVYVADQGNNTIRKITATGAVTTLAGSAGTAGSADSPTGAVNGFSAQFNSPTGVAVDNAGTVYVADCNNHTIRKITPGGLVTTLAGAVGVAGNRDGTGINAQFNYPTGLAVDLAGNLFVADQYNHTIRKITPGGVVTTLAGAAGVSGAANGTAAAAQFNFPRGVTVDNVGNIVVADSGNCTIRQITSAGTATTLAGDAVQVGHVDGSGTAARFQWANCVTVDATGTLYVTDIGFNGTALVNRIRKVTSAGNVSTLATLTVLDLPDGIYRSWGIIPPYGIGVDIAGNVYVANGANQTISKITSAGVATTLAGAAGVAGSADGPGINAQFNNPSGLAVDQAGNVFVADYSNYTIRKITPAGVVSTLAGVAGAYGSADGTGPAAGFGNLSGLAIDPSGNILVADSGNHALRKITAAGVVTTIATNLGVYRNDVTGVTMSYDLAGVALDAAGNSYVTAGSTIQKVTPSGVVTMIAGKAGACGSLDGLGSTAQFNIPYGITVDSAGNLYVADILNGAIRKGVIAGAPVISAQPQSQSVSPGGNVQLSVTVSSSITYACQWYLGTNALSGATGTTLNIASASTGNAGDYTVVVSNGVGSVTSNKATLTVSAAAASPSTSSSGGGGGAFSFWFIGALSLLVCRRYSSIKCVEISL